MKKFLPVFVLTLVFLLIFWPALTGGTFISTGMLYSDLMLYNYPLKVLYRASLLKNELPLWTSLLGNGYPLLAGGTVGAFYPLHLILFRFLPTLLAFNFNLFLHFLIASIFTFYFCRISLKLSVGASLLGGLVYSLSGFFVTHLHQGDIVQVVSLLPLLFLLTERWLTTAKPRFVFLLALVLSLQIFIFHLEMVYYCGIATVVFFFLLFFFFPEPGQKREGAWQTVVLFLSAFIMAGGIAAIQLLPVWELTSLSQRAGGLSFEYSSASVWPLSSLKLFINPKAYNLYLPTPDFHPLNPTSVNMNVVYGYVGLLPLLLAIFAVVTRWRNRYGLIFIIFLISAFVYGLGQSTQAYAILWSIIPGLKFFREPVKILFLIEFSLAILAAIGLDSLLKFFKNRGIKQKKLFILVPSLVLGITFLDLYFNNFRAVQPTVSARDWFTKPPAVEFLQQELKQSYFRIYTSGTANLDYATARDFPTQKELQNLLTPDYNVLYGIPSMQELAALFLKRQVEFNTASPYFDFKEKRLRMPPAARKILNLSGVKYLVSSLPFQEDGLALKKKIPVVSPVNHIAFAGDGQGIKRLTLPVEAIYVYENLEALPRAYFVAQVQSLTGKDEILKKVLSVDFDPTQEVVLEENFSLPEAEKIKAQPVIKIEEKSSNNLVLEAEVPQDGLLVLDDLYYPGWQAWVDGRQVKIYQANYLFRAVPVSQGKHVVEFRYRPTYWRPVLLISVVFLIITSAGLLFSIFRKK